ncbi:MAG: hypothetical protein KAH54_07610, partial [Candidatus Sabulitectum sp.]|nr:hypothetical protein [Candidatus Sabulitectum sp.]
MTSDRRDSVLTVMLFGCAVLFSTAGFAGVQEFTDVTAAMGIVGSTTLGNTVAWYDIDNDGDLDVGM